MKPILYPPEETEFVSNGLGILADAISCEVQQVLNGQYELTMQYPITGARFGDIKSRSIILAKTDPVSELQPFRVYEILKTSAGSVTVYAHHKAYDLKGVPITPFKANGPQLALQGIKQNAVTDCPFDFYTDISSTSAFSVAVPQPIWAVLGGQEGSLLDVFGGEYEFDRSTVKLLSSRGTNRGVTIRYGKNLTSLEQDENCANCYTGILPYYVDMETGEVSYAEGKVIYAEGEFGYTKILPVDMSDKFDEKPLPSQLKEQGEKYIKDNKVGIPNIGWTISWVQLENTEEYKGKALLERVLIGDAVSVHFPAMGISVAARAVEITYDTLLERYKDIRLGSVKASIANEIVSQGKDIEAKPSKSDMKSAISQMTNTLTGSAGGAVRLLDTNGDGKPDTLYIADDPDPDKAIKVWRFDYRGWGASETGYNGPFTMGATFEDGFLADFITAANLTAGTIQSQAGTFFIDLTNGVQLIQNKKDFLHTDYTESDVERALMIINGTIQPTDEDILKYDIWGNGTVDVNDAVTILNMVKNSVDFHISWELRLSPSTPGEVILVKSNSNYDGEDPVENVIFRVGAAELIAGSLKTSKLANELDDVVNLKYLQQNYGSGSDGWPQINDNKVSEVTTWSSQKIFDVTTPIIPIYLTQTEYDALEAEGKVLPNREYRIVTG